MTSSTFQRLVLEHLSVKGNRMTLAQAKLRFDLPVERLEAELEAMVGVGLLELGSNDDGVLYYHSPGLPEHPEALAPPVGQQALTTEKSRYLPSTSTQRAWGTFAIISTLNFIGTGLAAIIVHPAWEAQVLMWIALAGTPGAAVLLTWFINRALK